jgi:hypothetical protein
MLWYKSWLETRWRFLIGLVLLFGSAATSVMTYPRVLELLPMASTVDMGGELGRQVRESVELSRSFRGYVWAQWFRQNLGQLWTLFAVLLGTGGLLAQSSGTLFTLSLPLSRRRIAGVRAATGLTELLALAVVPSLLIPLLAPSIGRSYAVGDALVHGACLFVAGSVFFALTFLLSTVFNDVWRPPLIVLCLAIGLGLIAQLSPGLAPYSLFRVMSAEAWFRGTGLPWLALLAAGAAAAGLLFAAATNLERRDF